MDQQTSMTVKRFANVLKKHMEVDQLILFGSRARGDNFITSDYDFVLVSEEFSGKPFITRASPLYNLWQNRCDLEVLCYTPDEWQRLKDKRGILLNAQHDGICLL
jgi:predicted nucleotidyltransferase